MPEVYFVVYSENVVVDNHKLSSAATQLLPFHVSESVLSFTLISNEPPDLILSFPVPEIVTRELILV